MSYVLTRFDLSLLVVIQRLGGVPGAESVHGRSVVELARATGALGEFSTGELLAATKHLAEVLGLLEVETPKKGGLRSRLTPSGVERLATELEVQSWAHELATRLRGHMSVAA